MKAVLLTDTLQLVIMFIGIIGVFIYGVVHAGGFGEVMRIAKQSGRLDLLEEVFGVYLNFYVLILSFDF